MTPKEIEARKKRLDKLWLDPNYRRVSYWKELEDSKV